MAEPVVQALTALLKIQLDQTTGAIAKCPENRRFHQIAEGKATPLWLAGHLANTTNFVGSMIGLGQASALPKEWGGKFTPSGFGGNPITTNAEDYPSWDEIEENYKKVMGAFIEAVGGLTDEEIAGPCKGQVPPPLASMLPNLQAAINLIIFHDAHHRGQLALLAAAP